MGLIAQLEDLRAEIKLRIEEHLGEAVKQVIIGRKDKAWKFKPPLVWILPESGTIDGVGARALHEDWYPIFWLIGVSMKSDPDEARKEAETLAIKASAALLLDPVTKQQDRTLGDRVHYIQRIGWAPGDTRLIVNESLYGAGVQIRIRFETEEVE